MIVRWNYKPSYNWGGHHPVATSIQMGLSHEEADGAYPPWWSTTYPRGDQSVAGWWLSHPSENYEFVSWDDEIPNWTESHKIHVPNHRPGRAWVKQIQFPGHSEISEGRNIIISIMKED